MERQQAEAGSLLQLYRCLLRLRRASQALQAVLEEIHANLPQEAADRLSSFLERVIGWDWEIAPQALGVAFRARALRTPWMSGEPPKSMRTTVLFLRPGGQNGPYIAFPLALPWVSWEGFDAAPYMDRLRALGCVEGSDGEINLFLRERHSAEMFEDLYAVVKDIFADTERSLTAADQ